MSEEGGGGVQLFWESLEDFQPPTPPIHPNFLEMTPHKFYVLFNPLNPWSKFEISFVAPIHFLQR